MSVIEKPYIALYRKHRPKTFDDVCGQNAITQTLKNQIINNQIGHAYLFCGPRGTGKTSVAKIFAKSINCENNSNGNPCLSCDNCLSTEQNINIDIVEIDAASNNGVDNIRDLIEESKYLPQRGMYKVYIIDEVHMLSSSAFNALLKTLEEPTTNVVFILATTEEHKVPKTIRSRCQRHNFRLIKETDIILTLEGILRQENITYEDKALLHLARLSNGGLRDAVSLTDQCINYIKDGNITLEDVMTLFGETLDATTNALVRCIASKDIIKMLEIVTEQQQEGKQLYRLCYELYNYYRDEYFHSNTVDGVIYQRYMTIMAELAERLKMNNSRTIFEVEMIKMCNPRVDSDYESIYQRIQELEDIVQRLTQNKLLEFKMTAPVTPVTSISDNLAKEFETKAFSSCVNIQKELYYI